MPLFFAPTMDAPLTVLHEDETLLALEKPAGMLAVPGRGADKQDCLFVRVQACWPDARVVHRLDMATSGLMLLARGALVQRTLGMAFAARQVAKTYVAVVDGCMDGAHGRIELPLAADWPRRPLQKVDAESGKAAITEWTLLREESADRSRLELRPLTGRTHQLRVHLAAIGHPILGDALYAPPPLRAPRLLLHAQALVFDHPLSGERITLRCEAPF